MLSVSDDALEFPCNSADNQTGILDANISGIIKNMFGTDFLTKLNDKARDINL
jgi:hypothetical protein